MQMRLPVHEPLTPSRLWLSQMPADMHVLVKSLLCHHIPVAFRVEKPPAPPVLQQQCAAQSSTRRGTSSLYAACMQLGPQHLLEGEVE